MYTPSHFEMSEVECFQLIKEVSLGQIMLVHEGAINQAYVPFEFDQNKMCLFGHVAKKNGVLKGLNEANLVYVNFLGEHAYISPSWYLTNDQVPTWNYQAVKVEGSASKLNEEETLGVITRLSNLNEQQFEEPWTMDKLSEKKVAAMLKAIVGFRIDVTKISGTTKMSQNKDIMNRKNLIKGLKNQADDSSHQVAEKIDNTLT